MLPKATSSLGTDEWHFGGDVGDANEAVGDIKRGCK